MGIILEFWQKKINDQVDGIGKARARTLARTEIIRAHHAGMIGEGS